MRPKSIELFEKIYLGTVTFGFVIAVFNWVNVSATLETPELKALGAGSNFLIGIMALSLIFSLLIWYFIARRASNIAKWIYVVVTGIGLFGVIGSLANPLTPKGILLVGNIVVVALQLYAAWLLFKPDAAEWLESKGANGPGDPTTFD